MDTKLTILYERLSREDERVNESVSIENQKTFLEDYANRHGYTNIIHLTDDGWSGTRWDRPSYLKMIEEVEKGNVDTCIVKDMSRIGRDHLRVGLLLEQFREYGVRFIAVNDNVDTDKGMDDFTPFRNIINEWVARDTSRKIRTIFNAKTAQGKHVTGALPYGYLHNPDDRQKWILDDVASKVVKRIFRSVIEGKTLSTIAKELTEEHVLCPNAHWRQIKESTSMGKEGAIKDNRKKITNLKRRREEITVLIKKLYETYALEKIPEELFSDLLTGYHEEQQTIDSEVQNLQADAADYQVNLP